MTKHEIAIVGCKILAVYYFAGAALQFAAGIVQDVLYLFVPPDWPGAGGHIFMMIPLALIDLLMGVLIWRMASPIARRIAPVEE
jgi:hypothetical protein